MGEPTDIGVLGSGPAALAIGAALGRAGASVSLIAPEPFTRWRSNYCLWEDELSASLQAVEGLVERSWPHIGVASNRAERTLERRYSKLDTQRFQQFLWSELEAAAPRIIDGRAARLAHDDTESRVHLDDGRVERVRLVVDASGAGTRFVPRVHDRPPAHQIAYGLHLDAPGHGFALDRVVLMDFRPVAPEASEPPSFLYVLPLSHDRLFVEETSLANRPAVPMGLLKSRLETRLRSWGFDANRPLGEERCAIPMGLGLPARGQSVVPFGAAAAMVHPASGYSIAHTLRKATPVAAAILGGLRSNDIEHAVAVGNAALWPRPQRAVWELYAFALETLVSMTAAETAGFFDTFFSLPEAAWSGFLGGTLGLRELCAVMTAVFRELPASIRWRFLRTGMSAGAAPLARMVLRSGMT